MSSVALGSSDTTRSTRRDVLLPQVSHNACDIESEGSAVSPADGTNYLAGVLRRAGILTDQNVRWRTEPGPVEILANYRKAESSRSSSGPCDASGVQ